MKSTKEKQKQNPQNFPLKIQISKLISNNKMTYISQSIFPQKYVDSISYKHTTPNTSAPLSKYPTRVVRLGAITPCALKIRTPQVLITNNEVMNDK